MTKKSVEVIVSALNEAGVRYLIAGGLAVVAHGYVRFTADVDLILDLDEANVTKALASLASLGYVPRPPVPLQAFNDPRQRATWVREKGLMVFSLSSPMHPATEVDLFVEPPLDFDKAYDAALRLELAPPVAATFVGFSDLLKLKEAAGRPLDLADLCELRKLKKGMPQ